MRLFLILFLILTATGPLMLILSGKINFNGDYRTANRKSAHIAPDPTTNAQAIIQVYSARAFNWRGMFAVHVWLAIKPKTAKQYTVYQVIGWRLLRNLPPLMIAEDIPDRFWFNQRPHIILDIEGQKAETLIPLITQAANAYPYANDYVTWPGPNSNTFIAYIARQVPAMQLALPSNAVGKDFYMHPLFFARAPSGTGYQFSLLGLMGITLAYKEGLEINILGLVYGFSPAAMTLKLPGFGDIPIAFR